MKKYKYVATDKTGKKLKGTFVAENEEEMKEMLLKAGYYVTSFRQVSAKSSSFFSLSGKIRTSELSQFCNQFSVMIAAGISILDAIRVCEDQSFSPSLKSTLKKIDEDVKQGALLSEAMSKFPKIFPPFFSSMVFVGESAGCLDKVLITVADYYELEEKTKKKVLGSLAYPAVLVVLLIGVVIAMFVFVIPRFIDSFAKMDVEMPAITLAVFAMSNFFSEYWLYMLAFIAVFIIAIWALRFVPSVRLIFDQLKVTLPIFKRINMAIFTARLCRSLGLLLSNGADSLSALETLKKTVTNKYLEKQFSKAVDDVRMGMSLSAALSAEMKLSPILIQMIVVGEKTGELDSILVRTAPYFDAQAESALSLITTIVQPVVMVLLGAVVAVLFLSIYSPILSMITSLDTSGGANSVEGMI